LEKGLVNGCEKEGTFEVRKRSLVGRGEGKTEPGRAHSATKMLLQEINSGGKRENRKKFSLGRP